MEAPDMLKRVAIVYPSGNTTAVVFDQVMGVNKEQLNEKIMKAWRQKAFGALDIEQCCFVTLPKDRQAIARVEMFGGEFCGNATRSVIQLLTEGNNRQGMIEVSGVKRLLSFSVIGGSIAVEMPLPESGNLLQKVAEGTIVQLEGIAQLVVTDIDKQNTSTTRELLDILLKQNKYNLLEQPAVGIAYYERSSGKSEFSVWVKTLGTVFDETACGSGTCAIGVVSALQTKRSEKLDIIQPSGERINSETIFNYKTGEVISSSITGEVSVLYDGELTLP